MTMQELRNAIDALTPEDFALVQAHMTVREQELKARRVNALRDQLAPGQRVRIKPDAKLRPRYLLGLEAEVVGHAADKRVPIKFAEPDRAGRFGQSSECRVPIDCIEVIA